MSLHKIVSAALYLTVGVLAGGAFSAAYYSNPPVQVSVFRQLPGKTTIYQDRLVAGNVIEWRDTCLLKDCSRIAASEPDTPKVSTKKKLSKRVASPALLPALAPMGRPHD